MERKGLGIAFFVCFSFTRRTKDLEASDVHWRILQIALLPQKHLVMDSVEIDVAERSVVFRYHLADLC